MDMYACITQFLKFRAISSTWSKCTMFKDYTIITNTKTYYIATKRVSIITKHTVQILLQKKHLICLKGACFAELNACNYVACCTKSCNIGRSLMTEVINPHCLYNEGMACPGKFFWTRFKLLTWKLNGDNMQVLPCSLLG